MLPGNVAAAVVVVAAAVSAVAAAAVVAGVIGVRSARRNKRVSNAIYVRLDAYFAN